MAKSKHRAKHKEKLQKYRKERALQLHKKRKELMQDINKLRELTNKTKVGSEQVLPTQSFNYNPMNINLV